MSESLAALTAQGWDVRTGNFALTDPSYWVVARKGKLGISLNRTKIGFLCLLAEDNRWDKPESRLESADPEAIEVWLRQAVARVESSNG